MSIGLKCKKVIHKGYKYAPLFYAYNLARYFLKSAATSTLVA